MTHTHTQPERLRCEVCDMPTLGDTLCNYHYDEREKNMSTTHTKGPQLTEKNNALREAVEYYMKKHGNDVQAEQQRGSFPYCLCDSCELFRQALAKAEGRVS